MSFTILPKRKTQSASLPARLYDYERTLCPCCSKPMQKPCKTFKFCEECFSAIHDLPSTIRERNGSPDEVLCGSTSGSTITDLIEDENINVLEERAAQAVTIHLHISSISQNHQCRPHSSSVAEPRSRICMTERRARSWSPQRVCDSNNSKQSDITSETFGSIEEAGSRTPETHTLSPSPSTSPTDPPQQSDAASQSSGSTDGVTCRAGERNTVIRPALTYVPQLPSAVYMTAEPRATQLPFDTHPNMDIRNSMMMPPPQPVPSLGELPFSLLSLLRDENWHPSEPIRKVQTFTSEMAYIDDMGNVGLKVEYLGEAHFNDREPCFFNQTYYLPPYWMFSSPQPGDAQPGADRRQNFPPQNHRQYQGRPPHQNYNGQFNQQNGEGPSQPDRWGNQGQNQNTNGYRGRRNRRRNRRNNNQAGNTQGDLPEQQ